MLVLITALSALTQIIAAILSLRLTRMTGKRRAWWAMAAAFIVMALRRIFVLSAVLAGQFEPTRQMLHSEVFALVGSLLLLLGTALIGPVFRHARADASEARRLAERLADSENRLRVVLDALPEAFVVLDHNGRVLFCNSALARILGRAPGSVTEGDYLAAVGAGRVAELLASMPGDPSNPGSWNLIRTDVAVAKHGGATGWVDVVFRAATWDGTPVVVCLLGDATERRRSRQALAREERLFADGPVVLMRWEPSRSLVFATRNVVQWGFDVDRLLELGSFHACVHPDDLERVWRDAGAALEAGRTRWEQEYRLVCPDGTVRWVYDYTVVGKDERGSVTHFDGYLLDITSRKEVERELSASEERFRLAGQAGREVIYDWDILADHVYWSPNSREILGVSAETLGTTVEGWMSRLHPEDSGRVKSMLTAVVEHGESFSAEYRFKAENGSYIVLFDRGLIVRGDDGRARRMVGTMADVSELKRLEEQLNLSRRLEAIGSLAGGVAHDFNNLLTAIMASAELLQLGLPEDHEGHAEIRTIKATAKRAAKLTHSLLAFARRQVLQPVESDLNEIVDGFLPVLRRVIPENIELSFIAGHSLGTVRVDRGQMEQVLMNLCLNSRDAIPRGGRITIETENTVLDAEFREAHRWALEGRYVLLSVTDNGLGMDGDTVAHAFEPFFTTKRPHQGTGLGLPTVYGIVKQHEGFINVYSDVGRGTTIKIYLPIVARRAVAVGQKVEGPLVGGHERLLVVEDEESVRRTTVAMLGRLGYTVFQAGDGEEALMMLAEMSPPPDLVFSDVVMPRMGGPELREHALPKLPGLRFLFTSGYAEAAVHEGLARDGGVGFLAKPYAMDDLARKIRAILDRP